MIVIIGSHSGEFLISEDQNGIPHSKWPVNFSNRITTRIVVESYNYNPLRPFDLIILNHDLHIG